MELDLEIRPRGRAPRHVQAGIGRIGGGEAIVDPRDAQALLLQPLPRVREPDPEPVRRQQHDPAHRIAHACAGLLERQSFEDLITLDLLPDRRGLLGHAVVFVHPQVQVFVRLQRRQQGPDFLVDNPGLRGEPLDMFTQGGLCMRCRKARRGGARCARAIRMRRGGLPVGDVLAARWGGDLPNARRASASAPSWSSRLAPASCCACVCL